MAITNKFDSSIIAKNNGSLMKLKNPFTCEDYQPNIIIRYGDYHLCAMISNGVQCVNEIIYDDLNKILARGRRSHAVIYDACPTRQALIKNLKKVLNVEYLEVVKMF